MAIEIAPRITIDENVRFGKPVIAGTRMDGVEYTVGDSVSEWQCVGCPRAWR